MPGDEMNCCALVARSLILVLGLVGIVLSIVSATDCDFLEFSNSAGDPWPTLTDPFDNGVISAKVGMFSYQILDAVPPKETHDECIPYEEQFTELDNAFLAAASICAFCAPIFAGVGFLFILMEMCICNFCGSFLISSSLLIFASGLQAATFVVFAEEDYCYAETQDSRQQCEVGTAGILSGVAAFLLWLSGLIVCCAPRPEPYCFSSSTTNNKNKRGSSKNEPQVVVQPVIIDDNEFNDFDPNKEEEQPRQPSRKSSINSRAGRSSQQPLGSKITDEDFEMNSGNLVDDGTKVEVKEREFPDGSRQVDEITHYPDGSKSVKTQMFEPDEY